MTDHPTKDGLYWQNEGRVGLARRICGLALMSIPEELVN